MFSFGYRDFYFRVIIALVAAHVIVTFGADESLFFLFISWFYYRDLFLSFIIAFLLVNMVYLVTVKLDKTFDWREHTAVRIGLQLLLGLVIPAIAAFILAAGYFAIFSIRILDTSYLQFDFPVIVIMIVLLNVYYLAFYFYRQWQLTENRALNTEASVKDEHPKGKEVFVVHEGVKSIPLPIEDVCYFYHEGDFNFVRTCDRKDYLIAQTLDELQQLLNDKQFFRVNRQMIVNFIACRNFEPVGAGKLELIVTPPAKESVIISQKRAKQFKEWIER